MKSFILDVRELNPKAATILNAFYYEYILAGVSLWEIALLAGSADISVNGIALFFACLSAFVLLACFVIYRTILLWIKKERHPLSACAAFIFIAFCSHYFFLSQAWTAYQALINN